MTKRINIGLVIAISIIGWIGFPNIGIGQTNLFDTQSGKSNNVKSGGHLEIRRTNTLRLSPKVQGKNGGLPRQITFNPFPDTQIVLTLDEAEVSSFKNLQIIRARSNDPSFDHLPNYRDAVIIYNPETAHYTIQLSNSIGAFEMVPTSESGIYKVSEWSKDGFDCRSKEHHVEEALKESNQGAKTGCNELDANGIYVADLFVGYSYEAAFAVQDYDAHALSLAEEVNNGLINSNVTNIRIRLVGTAISEHNPGVVTSVLGDVYDWFEDEIAATAADYVASVQVPTGAATEAGGWAGVGGYSSVNSVNNAAGVFRHELGHNIGSSHCTPGILPYAAGYDNGNVKTHMCGNNINFYSTPLVNDAMGTPIGDTATADNARVWRERAAQVSARRKHTILFDQNDTGCGSVIANGRYHIQNVNSNKYLGTLNGSESNGTKLALADTTSTANEWDLVGIGDNKFRFIHVGSGRYIDVPGGTSSLGTDLIIWNAHGGSNQIHTITAASSDTYTIQVNNGQCIQVEGAGSSANDLIEQNQCDSSNNTLWRFIPTGTGTNLSVSVDITDVDCFGSATGSASMMTSGGSGNYTYLWSSGDTSSTRSDLAAGNYVVTVSDGQTEIPYSFEVKQPSAVVTTIAVNQSSGSDGAITLTASGGSSPYTYNWSNGQSGPTITNLAPGLFTVTITDNESCAQTKEVFVKCASYNLPCDDGNGNTIGDIINDFCECKGIDITCADANETVIELAQGKTATQSSTHENNQASLAIDGNVDGDYNNGSVALTGVEDYAWWQVDLGNSYDIQSLVIWNRTDYASSRIRDAKIFIADSPFTSADVATTEADPNVHTIDIVDRPNPVAVFHLAGHSGRYIRIQSTKTGERLQIAELEVYTCEQCTYYADTDNDGYGDANSPLQSTCLVTPTGYVDNDLDCNDSNPQVTPNTVSECGDPFSEIIIANPISNNNWELKGQVNPKGNTILNVTLEYGAGNFANSIPIDIANLSMLSTFDFSQIINIGNATAHQFRIKVTSSSDTFLSEVYTIDPNQDYCTPTDADSLWYKRFSKVEFNGIVHNDGGNAAHGVYEDATAVHMGQLDLSGSYELIISTPSSGWSNLTYYVYIDLNDDKDFTDYHEMVGTAEPNGQNTAVSITIPSTDILTNKTLTLRIVGAETSDHNTCYTQIGNVKDFSVSLNDPCTASTWYADTDNDGFGDINNTRSDCQQPTGYVANSDDCDDTDNSLTIPITWYRDADKDGLGDSSHSLVSCNQPLGYVADNTDIDDMDNVTMPHAHSLDGLIPVNTATHVAINSGSWFSPSTWDTGTVPSDAAIVFIPTGINVEYEGKPTSHIFAIRVDGTISIIQTNSSDTTRLIVDTFIGTMMSSINIHASTSSDGNIEIQFSPFDIEAHKNGTSGYGQSWNSNAISHFSDGATHYHVEYSVGPDKRFNTYSDALAGNTSVSETFRMAIDDNSGVIGRHNWDSTQVSLGLVTMGQIEIIGQEKDNMIPLSADATSGSNTISLAKAPVGWLPNDELIISRGGAQGTSNPGEDQRAIQSISGSSITLKSNLNKNHWNQPADELYCYVGNLTRNITFTSTSIDSTQRGHFMVMHNDMNVQIKNAAFYEMGRTDKSKILNDFVWNNWKEPVVFKSKISALGQEVVEMKRNPKEDISNMRGRYSIHLHKLGATASSKMAKVTGNVIWGNPGWGITHHDSHADISDNVLYDITGSGIVSESGSETGVWNHNLLINIKQGHKGDFYESTLWFDDYLFSGQGLGMKGRAVVCNDNVIANAHIGVGVMNISPSVENMDRLDPLALANRAEHPVNHWPLSVNGYSKEGDGVLPVEPALIMKNTTTIWCYQGLRSFERDMGVNHESRSFFDGFKCWGINQGLSITYQADYTFKDVYISGKNMNALGMFLWKHSHNHVFDNIKLENLGYGITCSKLVEKNGEKKTRNNGFTPWYFIDLKTNNVTHLYEIKKEDPSTATTYDEHGDNTIHLKSSDFKSRPTTFTILDSSELYVDYAAGDFQFEIDGIITDELGSYDLGIQQALAQGNLREGYPERIYEFASRAKFDEYISNNGVFKDPVTDELFFLITEFLPDRRTNKYVGFSIYVKIINAPSSGPFANPQLLYHTPKMQIVSRLSSVSQSSIDTNVTHNGNSIDVGPQKAIDGNTNGRINVQEFQDGLVPIGSFSQTKIENEPWYDLDLGSQKLIEYIDIWSFVNINGSALETLDSEFKAFYVLISDTPFENSDLATARNIADYEYYKDNTLQRKFSINNIGASGRYIRIQGEGNRMLRLSEVEVLGKSCAPTSAIDEITSCDPLTWIDGITYTTSNFSATHTLTNVAGCDSIVTLNYTKLEISEGIDVIESCDPLTWIDGITYTTSNISATHTLTNATGCDSIVTLNYTKLESIWYADTDNDGFGDINNTRSDCQQPTGYVANSTDCDDSNDKIYPNAPELCDGLDNDCDGDTDEDETTTWYADTDNDGFGDINNTRSDCQQPTGYVANSTDCDDTNDKVYPNAPELCDGLDNDCDGDTDEAVQTTWYADTDNDGFGDINNTKEDCQQPTGYVANSTDCDDTNDKVYPNAPELCDGLDNDCDGDTDEAVQTTWYADTDNDGFGDINNTRSDCQQPTGYVANSEDCDDTNDKVYPNAPELCDGLDNDCDGDTDEDETTTWYADTDNDGFGDINNTRSDCQQPTGYVANSTDCDDTNDKVYPDAPELCDGIDNDCDGDTDEDETTTWYADTDNDGFGDINNTRSDCQQPTGFVANSTDCDDTNDKVYPNAPELCDGLDNDCDGDTDEDETTTWYADTDNDGFGDLNNTRSDCQQPTGYVANSTDCDDTNDKVYPNAPELCDGLDNDCDGDTDEAVQTTWYADTDNDGFGDINNTKEDCQQPTGYVANSTDCDDTNDKVYPNAPELCDGLDNDCDGDTDEDETTTWYADTDNDGFGDINNTKEDCQQPTGYVANSTDCDDTNDKVYPNAPELCDGLDNDCDGDTDEAVQTTWYADTDNDGFGDINNTKEDCQQPTGYVANSTDCDDTNDKVYPNAPELCDGLDNDCDGDTDEDETTTWYADTDNDGFGDINNTKEDCQQPTGYVANSTDCDDSNDKVYPDAPELCDGLDNDCDGDTDEAVQTTWYADTDNDGFGDINNTRSDCQQPTGYVANSTDCDDTNDKVYPNAPELCDGLDNDCDGDTDEDETTTWYADTDNDGFGDINNTKEDCQQPTGYVANSTDCDDSDPNISIGLTWYFDQDDDGYGNPDTPLQACEQPAGYVLDNTDFDDTNKNIYPGAPEICDCYDNDGDDEIDEGLATQTWYYDQDGDLYGSPDSIIVYCRQPIGFVLNNLDCNDNDENVNPETIWYADTDSDEFGDSNNTITSCSQPAGYVANAVDCDDKNDKVFPNAPELCDGLDNDCDGDIDEEIFTTWYADADNDGFGDINNTTEDCEQPEGYVANSADCNDRNDQIGDCPRPSLPKGKLFPSPATSRTTLELYLPESTDLLIRLHGANGDVEIHSIQMSEVATGLHQIPIDISSLAAGMYFIYVRTNDHYFTKKLLVK